MPCTGGGHQPQRREQSNAFNAQPAARPTERMLLCALRPHRPGFVPRLLAALAAIATGSIAFRIWNTSNALPVYPLIYTQVDRVQRWFTGPYFPTLGRLHTLACGVLLGLLLRSPAAVNYVVAHRWAVSACAVALQAGVVATMIQPWHGTEPAWAPRRNLVFAALLHSASPLVALAIFATLLALIISADPVHAAIAKVLALPVFSLLSRLSLGLYCFHGQSLFHLLRFVESRPEWAGLMARRPDAALAIICVGVLGMGWAAAAAFAGTEAALWAAEGKKPRERRKAV